MSGATSQPDETPSGGLSERSWSETALAGAAASALLVLLTLRALHEYFFAEAFVYIGSWWRAGESLWLTVRGPHGWIFFRPFLWLVNLPFNLFLPAEPLPYHLRNLLLTVLTLVLFHRISLRFVRRQANRLIGLILFASSKAHFSTIGYVATFSSVVVLAVTMLAVVFLLRYMERRRPVDAVVAILSATCCIFSKDHGMAIIVVLAAAAIAAASTVRPPLSRREALAIFLPLLAAAAAYLAMRHAVCGAIPREGPYSLHFQTREFVKRIAFADSTFFNLSTEYPGSSGAAGLAGLFLPAPAARVAEMAATVVLTLLLLFTVVRGRRGARRFLFPAVWAVSFYGPLALLPRSQMYYVLEVVASLALLLAAALDEVPPALRNVWVAIALAVVANAAVSNRASLYQWQITARATEAVCRPILRNPPAAGTRRLTFLASEASLPFWRFALTADFLGPMVPVILQRPDLEVRVVDTPPADRSSSELLVTLPDT